jgi:thiol-disulfide isomerase/thioredoxin
VAHASRPDGVAWFNGGIERAFDAAKQQHKPVFVYFGAVWCPPCQELKATIFRRRDFLDRLTLYLPVYLDGDAPDAQRWAEQFHVTGYPTVLVLRADHSEIERVTGGMDLARYAQVLATGITALRPIHEVLASVKDPAGSLDETDCRILAYNGWEDDDAWIFSDDRPQDLRQLADLLTRAAQKCPASQTLERARLELTAAAADATLETDSLKAGKAPGHRLASAVARARPLLSEPVAHDVGDTLLELPQPFFTAARQLDPAHAAELERTFDTLMDQLATDARFSIANQLWALTQKVSAMQALEPAGKVPQVVIDQVNQRAAAALAQVHEPYARTAVVDAVDGLYTQVGDNDRLYQLLVGELKTSATPYYYMAELGELEQQRGHKDAAIDWYARSYHQAQGQATRVQWGARYVSALIQLRPQDEAAIRDTTLQVLHELGDGVHGRSRDELDRLFAQLHDWSRGGAHAAAVAAIRMALDQVCGPAARTDSAPDACRQLTTKI